MAGFWNAIGLPNAADIQNLTELCRQQAQRIETLENEVRQLREIEQTQAEQDNAREDEREQAIRQAVQDGFAQQKEAFEEWREEQAKKNAVVLRKNTMLHQQTQEKLTDVMYEIGMTEGFDIGLEMSGSQPGLSDMIHNMKHGGKIALLGLQRQDATVDLETVIFNGLNIRGIYGRKVWDTWYKMSTMIQAGLDISPIITHHFDIRDYEKGFEAMISGQSGKVILDWAHIND